MVAAVFVDDAVAGAVEPENGASSLSGPQPTMKLDAELANGNLPVEKLVNDVVFEPFDVHLEHVDGGITVPAHDGGEIEAVEGDDIEAILDYGIRTFGWSFWHGKLKAASVGGKADREELQVSSVACGYSVDSGRGGIEDEHRAGHDPGQLELEAHEFADASTIGDQGR